MRAMILAAGLGKRMRPLTLTKPKPLLEVAGIPLIEYHVKALVSAGCIDIVINHSWLGEQIEAYLGAGEQFGARISYSVEPELLETAGGIRKALPLLTAGGEEAFLVVNGDIFTDYPFKRLLVEEVKAPYLVLVPNPSHNLAGDFGLFEGMLDPHLGEKYTYSGVSVLPVAMFQELELDKPEALGPILHRAIDSKQVSAELYEGYWVDVGTPERLGQVDQWIKEQKIDGF